MEKQDSRAIIYQQHHAGQWQTAEAKVVPERPVGITVNGEKWLELLCTPQNLEELAVGFLYNEGLIQKAEELASVRVCAGGDNVDVWLNHGVNRPQFWRRTSGCSGGFTASPAGQPAGLKEIQLPADSIRNLLSAFRQSQVLYNEVRGIHSSALSDGERILVTCEDIGRHNTLDKLSGWCLLKGLALPQPVLLTTGRISSEMFQKSRRLGAAVVISLTAPTDLSIALAEQGKVTLIGYARGERFSVYTCPERILISRSA